MSFEGCICSHAGRQLCSKQRWVCASSSSKTQQPPLSIARSAATCLLMHYYTLSWNLSLGNSLICAHHASEHDTPILGVRLQTAAASTQFSGKEKACSSFSWAQCLHSVTYSAVVPSPCSPWYGQRLFLWCRIAHFQSCRTLPPNWWPWGPYDPAGTDKMKVRGRGEK